MDKKQQKKIILDIMNEDAENGVYDNIPFNPDNIKQKPFNIALVRDMMDYYDLAEISFSRMVEMLNDIAIKWHENHIGDTNKMVEHHIVDANKMINMRPKEKAQDLVNKYINLTDGWVMGIENWKHKKQCALVAVDEIINALNSDINPLVNYWYEVKQEIEKL